MINFINGKKIFSNDIQSERRRKINFSMLTSTIQSRLTMGCLTVYPTPNTLHKQI